MVRLRQVLVVLASAAAVPAAVAVPAAPRAGAVPAVRAAGIWGRAIAVPGLLALNSGGNAAVSSVSCASPGNCAAGGYYRIHGGVWDYQQQGHRGFVADERRGRWGKAVRVPGLRDLAAGGVSSVGSVSCGAAGNCAAGGDYWNHGHQGFVAVEKNGRWGRAVKTAGPVRSVSCASAGNCVAGGTYRAGGRQRGFVVVEKNGRWSRGIEVPGLAALNTGGNAAVSSVSCASAGNCAAGGTYRDVSTGPQGFVAVLKNGAWGHAIEVPGLAALNTGGNAAVDSVSCASAGNCAAGGSYTDNGRAVQGFVASEKNGVWGQAIEVPGLGAMNIGDATGYAYAGSVSCGSAGNCAAGGSVGEPYPGGFVVSEKNGSWGKALWMPGPGTAIRGARIAWVSSVSCASPGNCGAGGPYGGADNPGAHGFVAAERNGRWDQAIEVPGLAALNKALNWGGGVSSVSCASAGSCTAGGSYMDRHGEQGFVT